jgi:hypothetical protein
VIGNILQPHLFQLVNNVPHLPLVHKESSLSIVIPDLLLKRRSGYKRVMDDTILAKLSEVNDALVEHLKWLLEQKNLDALSRVIPIVDNLTRILIEIRQTSLRA